MFISVASDERKLRVVCSYSLPFWVKQKADVLKNEIREVEELDNWQPAIPLIHSLFSTGRLNTFKE